MGKCYQNSQYKNNANFEVCIFALQIKDLGWWPGTELNRRRQPFQGVNKYLQRLNRSWVAA